MPPDSDPLSRFILLVEDNPDDEGLALRALKKSGVSNTVVIARDGEEASQKVASFTTSETPGLILLDLKLPKLSGMEVLERIRQNELTKYVPVVVLTSSDESVDVQSCYALGANAFVRKPVDFDEFIATVNSIAQFWVLRNLITAPSR